MKTFAIASPFARLGALLLAFSPVFALDACASTEEASGPGSNAAAGAAAHGGASLGGGESGGGTAGSSGASAGLGGVAGFAGAGAGVAGTGVGGTGVGGAGACGAGLKLCGGECVAVDDPAYGCSAGTCAPCAVANGIANCAGGECGIASCSTGFGNCNQLVADGCETDLMSNTSHCSICDSPCDLRNAQAACSGGLCIIEQCDFGYADCDARPLTGCEANTLLDPSHCGECNKLCQPVGSSACANGVCQTTGCAPGTGDCDGVPDNGCEVDTTSTLEHCSFCGNLCALANATAACSASQCVIESCDTGFEDCDGVDATGCEVDIDGSSIHCGACDAPCSTANNTSRACSGGRCSYVCNSGFADCNGPQSGATDDGCETAVAVDVNNCGSCGILCTNTHGFAQCSNGTCVPSCDVGWGDCDGNPNNGCETSTSDSVAHCGSCGIACTNANGGTACVGGACVPTCSPGFSDCDGNPNNGCETATDTDPAHCGSCGTICTALNGTNSCVGGSCVPSCANGFGDCDSSPNNGCETNTQQDPQHCGQCGEVCQPEGSAACANGVCQTTGCPTGFGDCDGRGNNGCEQDLTSSPDHCGFCDNVCVLANATAGCASSACTIVSCNAGFADCDGIASTGCEIDTENTTAHCGGCNAPCSTVNNTSRACTAGACNYVCNPGFSDCNGPEPGTNDDGCETTTAVDVNNCGACGASCTNAHGFTSCSNGACVPSCDPGWGDCDGDPSNGCETSTSGDVANCGACGATCSNNNGTTACVAGECVPNCDTGFSDCDGNPSNGCETATSSDVANCGGCGALCTALNGSTSCVDGSCVPLCDSGFGDCDGSPQNGCEAGLVSDPNNCGACGNDCAAPHATTGCVSGACEIVYCAPQYYDIDKNPATGCEYQCSYAVPGPETCDGTDEDCDAQIDEDFDLTRDAENCGTCGNACGSATGGLCCTSACQISNPNNCGACGRSCTSGMLIINEIHIDPDAVIDSQGEWFELFNPNAFDIDIRGFVIRDLGTDNHTISSAVPVIVPAGGYLVLGNNANTNTNGGVQVAYQYGTFFFGNDGDELVIVAHGVELDRLVWKANFDKIGKSQELSVNHQSITANDVATNWCTAVDTYGDGDLGTPGSVNTCSL